MASSSLSSVVSGLVRASMGSSLPGTITDEDLDRHIGEIILREAKQKAERYKQEGIRAFLPTPETNVPRANKRFLSSIIRSTDDHNKAIMRSQIVAAAELKEEREEQERRERRARADEAAQDRLRRLMSGGRRGSTEDRWRPERGRERDHKSKRQEKGRARSDLSEDDSRSLSRDWNRYWNEDEEEVESRREHSSRRSRRGDDVRNDRRRHRHRRHLSSRSRSHSLTRSKEKTKSHPCSRSPSPTRTNGDTSRHHRRRRRRSSSRSRSPRRDKHASKRSYSTTLGKASDDGSCSRQPQSPLRPRSPSGTTPKATSPTGTAPSPPPAPSRTPSPLPISSKMDKYFSPTYDPRLDVAPLASSSRLVVDVPSTGLIDNAQFEGWDAMLELIKIRREDRAERKRLERLGLLPEKGKDKEGRGKKGKGMVSASAEDGKGIMDIAYQKKGAVREWDMGKEGF